MNAETFLADIPPTLACSAYAGTSFTPDKRGDSARHDFLRSEIETARKIFVAKLR